MAVRSDRVRTGGRPVRRSGRRRILNAGIAGVAIVTAVVVAATALSGGSPTRQLHEANGLTVNEVSIGHDATHLLADVNGARALPPVDGGTLATVADAESAFGLALTRQLAAQTPGDNVVDSPLSADLALSMLQLGARGATQTEIGRALHAGTVPASTQAAAWAHLQAGLRSAVGHELALADSAWLQRGVAFAPSYLAALAHTYGDNAYLADFAGHNAAAIAAINDWVSQHTGASIRRLFDPGALDPSTILVLADALNFEARWAPSVTMSDSSEIFIGGDGRGAAVPAVRNDPEGLPLPAAVTAAYRAVEIPYRGNRYQALVIQPAAGTVDRFVRSLDNARLHQILRSMNATAVALTMPTLDLTVNRSLDAALSKMGMAGVFRPGADLSGISTRADHVGVVEQADRLVLNKEGTHFAAATGVGIVASAAPVTVDMTIDRPYLLLLRDATTGMIVAEAVIDNPASAE